MKIKVYLWNVYKLLYLIFTDQWNIVTNMPTRRVCQGVAALDNKIYVTADVDGQLMSSVDCYDPDTNTWSQVANMNMARWGHSLVSLHGRLYAIGGDVYSVEVYDPDDNTWTLLQHKLNGIFEPFGPARFCWAQIIRIDMCVS